MAITITGTDRQSLDLVRQLALKLGLKVSKGDPDKQQELTDKKRSDKLYKLIRDMAESGGIQSIKDLIKWQNEVREDKTLYGRGIAK